MFAQMRLDLVHKKLIAGFVLATVAGLGHGRVDGASKEEIVAGLKRHEASFRSVQLEWETELLMMARGVAKPTPFDAKGPKKPGRSGTWTLTGNSFAGFENRLRYDETTMGWQAREGKFIKLSVKRAFDGQLGTILQEFGPEAEFPVQAILESSDSHIRMMATASCILSWWRPTSVKDYEWILSDKSKPLEPIVQDGAQLLPFEYTDNRQIKWRFLLGADDFLLRAKSRHLGDRDLSETKWRYESLEGVPQLRGWTSVRYATWGLERREEVTLTKVTVNEDVPDSRFQIGIEAGTQLIDQRTHARPLRP